MSEKYRLLLHRVTSQVLEEYSPADHIDYVMKTLLLKVWLLCVRRVRKQATVLPEPAIDSICEFIGDTTRLPLDAVLARARTEASIAARIKSQNMEMRHMLQENLEFQMNARVQAATEQGNFTARVYLRQAFLQKLEAFPADSRDSLLPTGVGENFALTVVQRFMEQSGYSVTGPWRLIGDQFFSWVLSWENAVSKTEVESQPWQRYFEFALTHLRRPSVLWFLLGCALGPWGGLVLLFIFVVHRRLRSRRAVRNAALTVT